MEEEAAASVPTTSHSGKNQTTVAENAGPTDKKTLEDNQSTAVPDSTSSEENEIIQAPAVPDTPSLEENEIPQEEDEESQSQSGNPLLLNVTDDLTPLTNREPQLTVTSKTRTCRCNICGRSFKRCALTVCLTVVVLLYAVGGGFLFSHLESNRDVSFNSRTEKYKNDTAILLATELRQVSPYEDVWARTVFHYLDVFERDIIRASYLGYRRRDDPGRGQTWTFRSAVFFSLSLMTTTGYGTSTPHSEWSRTIVLGYSALGIPLTFTWLIVTGSTLAVFWSWLFDRIFCHMCHKNHTRVYPEETEPAVSSISIQQAEISTQLIPGQHSSSQNDRLNTRAVVSYRNITPNPPKPRVLYLRRKSLSSADHVVVILFSGVLFVAYFVFGSTVVAIMEGWSIADSVYFNFVMFATIGPGCQELEGGLSTQRWEAIRIRQNVSYLVFILVGFCLLSMFCNLVYNFYRYKMAKQALKKRKKLKMNIRNSMVSLSAENGTHVT